MEDDLADGGAQILSAPCDDCRAVLKASGRKGAGAKPPRGTVTGLIGEMAGHPPPQPKKIAATGHPAPVKHAAPTTPPPMRQDSKQEREAGLISGVGCGSAGSL